MHRNGVLCCTHVHWQLDARVQNLLRELEIHDLISSSAVNASVTRFHKDIGSDDTRLARLRQTQLLAVGTETETFNRTVSHLETSESADDIERSLVVDAIHNLGQSNGVIASSSAVEVYGIIVIKRTTIHGQTTEVNIIESQSQSRCSVLRPAITRSFLVDALIIEIGVGQMILSRERTQVTRVLQVQAGFSVIQRVEGWSGGGLL